MKPALDKMSRLVVPKGLRDHFALKPGDSLEVTLEPDGIRLRPVQPSSPIAEEDGILVCSSEVPRSMWDIGGRWEGKQEFSGKARKSRTLRQLCRRFGH